MEKKSVFSALSELMERNKKLRTAIYAGMIILALVIFFAAGGFGSRKAADTEKKDKGGTEIAAADNGDEDARQLESRLSSILSNMSGVGRVEVMITFESTSEIVIATEEETNDGGSGSSSGSRPATLSGSGGESPIILTRLNPKIRGVVVIAEGASNISVRMNIIAAASTALGIKEDRVEVFEMNGG